LGKSYTTKTKKEIILVDDDKHSLETLSKLLTEDGYNVTTSLNGKEALERIHDKKYDVIVTDLKMPGMGGIELLKNIRKFDPDIPVIIITAFGEVGSYVEATVKGVYDYINKPINYYELLRILETIWTKKE